jgi:hypothetical protein
MILLAGKVEWKGIVFLESIDGGNVGLAWLQWSVDALPFIARCFNDVLTNRNRYLSHFSRESRVNEEIVVLFYVYF